jgi:hypothetical protein
VLKRVCVCVCVCARARAYVQDDNVQAGAGRAAPRGPQKGPHGESIASTCAARLRGVQGRCRCCLCARGAHQSVARRALACFIGGHSGVPVAFPVFEGVNKPAFIGTCNVYVAPSNMFVKRLIPYFVC